jgi:hypothetical protein
MYAERQLSELRTTVAKDVDRIVQHCMRTQYERSGGPRDTYCIRVAFDPAMVGYGALDECSLRFIAERVSHQIAREITAGKFLHRCEDDDARRFRVSTPFAPGSYGAPAREEE